LNFETLVEWFSYYHDAGQINILLNFANGSSEVVLSEPGEVIPIKCLNYVNQFIEGKRIPEGEFREKISLI